MFIYENIYIIHINITIYIHTYIYIYIYIYTSNLRSSFPKNVFYPDNRY